MIDRHGEVSASGEALARVNIRLSRETHKKMNHLIPWGLRRNVVEAVLNLVLDAVERDGIAVAGAILDGHFRLEVSHGPSKGTKDPYRRENA